MMNITKLEKKALVGLYEIVKENSGVQEPDELFDDCYGPTDVEEVAEKINESINTTKGVIGSLIKKGLAYSDNEIINLNPSENCVKLLKEI